MDGLGFPEAIGGVVSLLLSIIAYLLQLLVQDFRQMQKEQASLRELFVLLKADQQRIWDWLSSKKIPGTRSKNID
ncbi:hypothetical protein [Aquiflexum sp.]|uniref:hypothetical protein n=1 Tax=Aquiflexum sp. TaxID=1872584 RepID=UPI0035943AC8